MRRSNGLFSIVMVIPFISPAWGATDDATVAVMRSRITDLGRAIVQEANGQSPTQQGPPHKRTPREEGLYQLSRAPREPVRAAIDEILKNGTKEERIGALTLYRWIVTPTYGAFLQEPLNPSYLSRIYELLEQDDRKLIIYTGTLSGALGLYPMSRKTVLVDMDIAEHATDPKIREEYLVTIAGRLGIELPIYKQTPPAERQKILSDFEAWFARNKDQIAFDEKGRSLLAGSKVTARPRALHAEDRSRIRQDPVCVLKLMQASIGGSDVEETTEDLIGKCGEALYGSEANSLLAKAMDASKKGEQPSLDLQLEIARARGKYPMTDAVLLAVAYVAAYDSDPANRDLARISLDQFGSPDIPRVLKGEPEVVHQKMEELGDEVLKSSGKH